MNPFVVSDHPHLDEGRKVWAVCADEHLEVDRLDVEVEVQLCAERVVAQEAVRIDGHFAKIFSGNNLVEVIEDTRLILSKQIISHFND